MHYSIIRVRANLEKSQGTFRANKGPAEITRRYKSVPKQINGGIPEPLNLPNIKREREKNMALFLAHRHALGKPYADSTTPFPQDSVPNMFCKIWINLCLRVHLEIGGPGFRVLNSCEVLPTADNSKIPSPSE